MKYRKATVAEVVDNHRLVLNKGALDGVKKGMEYLIYSLSSYEITDPETGERLGYLELKKGLGEVVQVQEKLSVLRSSKFRRGGLAAFSALGGLFRDKTSDSLLPFENPMVGDKAILLFRSEEGLEITSEDKEREVAEEGKES